MLLRERLPCFACFLSFVFVDVPRAEITTLIVKSLFPVHPIADAIQSVNVCHRDLEKDPSVGLGRVVLPSIVFHGTYDFALLAITSSWRRSHKEDYFYRGGEGGGAGGVAIASLLASLLVVSAGGLHYARASRAQYARLRGGAGDGGGGGPPEAGLGLLL